MAKKKVYVPRIFLLDDYWNANKLCHDLLVRPEDVSFNKDDLALIECEVDEQYDFGEHAEIVDPKDIPEPAEREEEEQPALPGAFEFRYLGAGFGRMSNDALAHLVELAAKDPSRPVAERITRALYRWMNKRLGRQGTHAPPFRMFSGEKMTRGAQNAVGIAEYLVSKLGNSEYALDYMMELVEWSISKHWPNNAHYINPVTIFNSKWKNRLFRPAP